LNKGFKSDTLPKFQKASLPIICLWFGSAIT
jgi:hypothetical protein